MLAEGGQLGTVVGKTGSNFSEAVGSPAQEPQGKTVHRTCLSPGSAPYSRDRADEEVKGVRGRVCADIRPVGMSSSTERHRLDHTNKEASSSDTESDFYEEIDVSCTPESMDYPNGKGNEKNGMTLFISFSSTHCMDVILKVGKCKLLNAIDVTV